MNDRCADNLATLLRLIEHGDEIPADLKSHLATCEECMRLLDAMRRVQSDIEREEAGADEGTVVADTVEKSAAAVRRSSRARTFARAIAVLAVLAAAAAIVAYGVRHPGDAAPLIGIFVFAAFLFVVVAILRVFRQRLHAPGSAVYKRLKPGRQLDGVCLGLAEAMGIPVIILRVIFVALIFVNGAGVWMYLLFSLLMPVHPDDRQYLLRFQLARAFRRMTGRQ